MQDKQEIDLSLIEHDNDAHPETILARLKSRVPSLDTPAKNEEKLEKATAAVGTKFKDILQDYADSPDKSLVSGLLSRTVAAGCVAYGINPIELIVIPRPIQQGENHVAMADRKKVGPMDIKQLFIDPEEIMFRVELLRQHGDTTAKNVTDLMFVFMHEMAHLGQMIHAEEDLNKSKQFAYANRPTERHADEVALGYCRNVNTSLEGKPDRNRADEILRQGLPQTIKDATANRRPSA